MTTDLDLTDARHRLRDATARIQSLKGDAARVLHALGTVLREVEETELWRAGGHSAFSAYLEEEAQVARTTALRAIEVARHFNADQAERYGFDKLALGLRYMALTAAVELPGDLIAADVRLRGANGRYTSVPFHTATVRQLQDAVTLATHKALPQARGDALGERLARISASLPPPPPGMTPAKERVEVGRTRTGAVALTFRQIPLDDLAAFVAALQAELEAGG